MNLLKTKKIGFLGAGTMSQALIRALIESQLVAPEQIFASNRSEKKLQKVMEQNHINSCSSNEELVEKCDIVFLAMKPQDLHRAIEPLAMSFRETHIVLSLAAGIPLKRLQKLLPQNPYIVRVMPNTPAQIRRAVVGYSLSTKAESIQDLVEDLLRPLGYVVEVEEGEMFEALTIAAGGGTGFVFELMQYWQDWLEDYGYESDVAQKMTIEVFLGASMLAQKSSDQFSLIELQRQVVSEKGVTFAGLESMRELEVDRLLRIAFEKAIMRDRELGDLKD